MSLSSDCCGAWPWMDITHDEADGTISGMCGKCKEHCSFIDEEEENRKEEMAYAKQEWLKAHPAPKNPFQDEIVAEICKALTDLGAGINLLSTVGSWGDTLGDQEVLGLLRAYNSTKS